LVARWIAGQTILVPVSANVAQLESIYTLNETGTMIWELIDGRTPLDKITEAVTAQYNVAAEEAARDVRQFLDSLEEAGLICPSHGVGG
jgi:hypothetical protein